MYRRAAAMVVCAAGCGTQLEVVVDHYLQPCVGMAPQTCTRVAVDGGPYELWYGGIDEFTFRWGEVTTLAVTERQRAHPPADGSSVQWRAREVLDSEPVEPGESFVFDVGGLAEPYVDFRAGLLVDREFTCVAEVDCASLAADPSLAGVLTFEYADPIDDPLRLVSAE
ncbi:MAG: DUF4377 domain-containing protein [Myxococcota bacterium]